jgi:hypothetical protein
LQTATLQWLPHSTAFCKLVPGEAYDKRQSGKRLPDQLQHQSRLLFLLIWQHLQPMMTMLQSANELQHWKKPKQLHHQRDPSVATDYYIQSTEQEPMSGQAEVKRL